MCDVSKRANLKPNSGDLLAGYLAVMSIVLLIAVFVVFRSCSGIDGRESPGESHVAVFQITPQLRPAYSGKLTRHTEAPPGTTGAP
jgi:hypothetical protein